MGDVGSKATYEEEGVGEEGNDGILGDRNNGMKKKEGWKEKKRVIRQSNLNVSDLRQPNLFLEESFGEFQEVRY